MGWTALVRLGPACGDCAGGHVNLLLPGIEFGSYAKSLHELVHVNWLAGLFVFMQTFGVPVRLADGFGKFTLTPWHRCREAWRDSLRPSIPPC